MEENLQQAVTDALTVIADYGDNTAERYRKFRYTWPRTAEEKGVEAARQTAKRYWQKAYRWASPRDAWMAVGSTTPVTGRFV